MEYTVVKKTDATELITEINVLISKGWKPTGGISICFGRVRNTTGGSKDWTEVLFHAQGPGKGINKTGRYGHLSILNINKICFQFSCLF